MKVREKRHFELGNFELKETLGTGTFGRVRLTACNTDQKFYALKMLKKVDILRLKQVSATGMGWGGCGLSTSLSARRMSLSPSPSLSPSLKFANPLPRFPTSLSPPHPTDQVDHIKSEVRILSMIEHPFIVNMAGHFQNDAALFMVIEYVQGGELYSHLRREVRFNDEKAKYYAAEIVLAFCYLHGAKIIYRDLKPENLLISQHGHVKVTDFGFAKIVEDRTWTLCGTPE
jgi:serine/threonine protein kinase